MKLSSISLISTALAAIASIATAASAPRPFERGVDIYRRAHPDDHRAAMQLHDEAANENVRAYCMALEMGHQNASRPRTAAIENDYHMKRHREAMVSGTPYDLSTMEYAEDTKRAAVEAIAEVKPRLDALHEAAAARHHDAAEACLVASERAKAVGWYDHAAFHANAAERNDVHRKGHIQAKNTGTAYDLSSRRYADSAKGTAHETIAKVDHEEAARLNLYAYYRAEEQGWKNHAKFHHGALIRNAGHVQGDIQDPVYAEHWKAMAHKTLTKVEHAEAVTQNRLVSKYAHDMQWHQIGDHHKNLADRNSIYIQGDVQDSHLAKDSKEKAHATVAEIHKESARVHQQAADHARQNGWHSLYEVHTRLVNKNLKDMRGHGSSTDKTKLSTAEYAISTLAEAHTTLNRKK